MSMSSVQLGVAGVAAGVGRSEVMLSTTVGRESLCLHSGKLEEWKYSSWCTEHKGGTLVQNTSVLEGSDKHSRQHTHTDRHRLTLQTY